MLKNKRAEHFQNAMAVILLAISISIVAFATGNKITGFAVEDGQQAPNQDVFVPSLKEFNSVNDLSTLSAGNYYIDGDGIVYWLDDDSRPSVAKVNNAADNQKYRQIYIDADGNIGYVIQ